MKDYTQMVKKIMLGITQRDKLKWMSANKPEKVILHHQNQDWSTLSLKSKLYLT